MADGEPVEPPRPGLNGGIVPMAPRGRTAMLEDYISPAETFVTCPNQDVVYGNGYFSLDREPVVVQVPNFGDRFRVYAFCDRSPDQFGRMGKPCGTRPAFYLLAGPYWRGWVRAGIAGVVRSPTELANAIPRIFLNDIAEDRRAIRPVVNQVAIYPLAEFNGRTKVIDYAALPHFPVPPSTREETHWVVPE